MTERVWIELIESSREFVQYIIMVLKTQLFHEAERKLAKKNGHCFQEFFLLIHVLSKRWLFLNNVFFTKIMLMLIH